MIKRIVKMTFHEDKVDDFLNIFLSKKKLIRDSPGCLHLELLRDIKDTNIFFTYSFWEQESDLHAYRYSDLFKKTWADTKVLFADKPAAWSVEVMAVED